MQEQWGPESGGWGWEPAEWEPSASDLEPLSQLPDLP